MFYKDKVVLVTGGADGIGRAIVEKYCELKAKVVIADKDDEKGNELEERLKKKGYDVLFCKTDVKQEKEIIKLFDTVWEKYGRLHILINNAGISKFKSLYEITVKEWDEIINTNLRSAFLTSREFARRNKGCSYGRIINIASTRYLMSEPNSEAYAASKGGIVSLTHALAISLSREMITVNCISPGWIQTSDYHSLRQVDHAQHPSLRVGKPRDIANTCVFLTDTTNDFINGANIVVDGGMTRKMIYEE